MTAVCYKVVILLLFVYCCSYCKYVDFVFGPCFVAWFLVSFQVEQSIAEEERAGCFIAVSCVSSQWFRGLVCSL